MSFVIERDTNTLFLQLDCPSVRYWAHTINFAVGVQFQIRDHSGFLIQNCTGHVRHVVPDFCKTSKRACLTNARV